MNSCVFLDRDGVMNYDDPNYVYQVEKLIIYQDLPSFIEQMVSLGYIIIIISNQAGISRGLYTVEQVMQCFDELQAQCHQQLSDFYYSPYHPSVTESLSRKPGTLLFERAMAKWNIDPASSWMVGDKPTDLEPALKLGINVIGMQRGYSLPASAPTVQNLTEAGKIIENSVAMG